MLRFILRRIRYSTFAGTFTYFLTKVTPIRWLSSLRTKSDSKSHGETHSSKDENKVPEVQSSKYHRTSPFSKTDTKEYDVRQVSPQVYILQKKKEKDQ